MDKKQESSSETSSYHSEGENILGNQYKGDGKDFDLESASDMSDEDFGVPTAYVKTAHEIDPKEAVEKAAPKFDQDRMDDLDEIDQFGNVV